MLAWGRAMFGRAVRDVFAWSDRGGTRRFALQGPAETMYAKMGFVAPRTNRGRWLDLSLGKHFGIPMKTESTGSGLVIDTDPAISHLDHHDEVGPAQWLLALDETIKLVLGLRETQDVACTIIPEPGYPWDGEGTRYYSAARDATVEASRPTWEVIGEAAEAGYFVRKPRPVADWCALTRRSEVPPGDPISLGSEMRLFVTHTVELHDGWDWRGAASGVARCRGLLFPSLALGPIPASNFGPCTFFFPPSLVTGSLKPNRPRGRRADVVLYATDAYTPTTANMVGSLAAQLYDELTGRTDADTYQLGGEAYLHALGPQLDDEGGPVGNRIIQRVDQMHRIVRSRFRLWKGPMTPREFARAEEKSKRSGSSESRGAHEFAYLEAKARTVVPLSAARVVFVPQFDEADYRWFLEAAGYAGEVVTVRTTAEEREAFSLREMDETLRSSIKYNYGWRLADLAAREE